MSSDSFDEYSVDYYHSNLRRVDALTSTVLNRAMLQESDWAIEIEKLVQMNHKHVFSVPDAFPDGLDAS